MGAVVVSDTDDVKVVVSVEVEVEDVDVLLVGENAGTISPPVTLGGMGPTEVAILAAL